MKIIDLLNKMVNREIETFYKFVYRGKIVTMQFLIDNYLFLEILNDEIEILDDEDEEKELPIKLKLHSHWGGTFESEQKFRNGRDDEITFKINEIIDYLEKQR